jgi:hypothetical protein
MKFIVSALILALLLRPGNAQETYEEIQLDSDFEEQLLPRSKINTEVVMGVMLTGAGGDGNLPQLKMAVPNSWKPAGNDPTLVCARITSKNGLYSATNVYRLSAGLSRKEVPLKYPTKYKNFLSNNPAVVRITLGDCSVRPRTFAAALWDAHASDKTLNVFLNAAGQPAAVALDGPSDFRANCIDESEESGLKYTTRCEVPFANLKRAGPTTLFFSVKRSRTVERFQIDIIIPTD